MARYTSDTSPWKKRVLLPFWILRDLLTLLIIATYAVILATINADAVDTPYNNSNDGGIKAAKAIVGVYMGIFAVSFLLDVYSMIQAARHNLSPRTFLIINVLQTTWWTVIIILIFIGNASYGRAFVPIFSIVCFLLYLGLLIYASIIFHRDRRTRRTGGAYAPTANPTNQFSAQAYGQAHYAPYDGTPAPITAYGQAGYTEAYAPRAQELKNIPIPAQQQRYQQATEYFSPNSVGATSPHSPLSAGVESFVGQTGHDTFVWLILLSFASIDTH
ncbi:Cys/Met metabolism pyridoxal phosphate-dependent enzyme [Macrophomina phaseolina MS6]|uniref:Cys/Met metabolism pyridoxal phosphate-dependent enzyme n=1 Tax=Macrophomina phaseolina (strain MS6) TaxID=1126212 RepID=K2QK97_MACPH|nr:Cys/Met metabolism pyridoxal phosphate-dependent enzyme [Macrophomina phaseolina MS6]